MNPKAVFACNELDLKEVKVYGFDYDYTLACYKPSLDFLLYNLGRQTLIEQYKANTKLNKNKKGNLTVFFFLVSTRNINTGI